MILPAWRYALRSSWGRRRRWTVFVLAIAVGFAVIGAALGVAARASQKSRETADRDGANRVIDVEGSLNTGANVRLDAVTLARLQRIPGVEAVLPSSRAALGLKTVGVPGALFVAEALQTSRPPIVAPRGQRPRLRPGDVLLPARTQGANLVPLLGRRAVFESQRAVGPGNGVGTRYPLRVAGLYDPSFQRGGQDVAYVNLNDDVALAASGEGLSVREFQRRIGFDSAEVVARRGVAVGSVLRRVQALDLPATTLSQRLAALPTLLAIGQNLGRLLAVILLAIVVASTAGHTASAVRARRSEIGVLRTVGYGRAGVIVAFATEATLATLAAAVLGAAGSVVLSALAGRILRSHLDDGQTLLPAFTLPAPGPLAVIIAASVASAIVGAGLAATRGARLDPSLALRPD